MLNYTLLFFKYISNIPKYIQSKNFIHSVNNSYARLCRNHANFFRENKKICLVIEKFVVLFVLIFSYKN